MERIWVGILALIATACSTPTSTIPEPTEKMALELGVETAELVRGYEVYMTHCNQCHERVPPGKIDPEYWRGILPHMAVNAELSAQQEREALLYLLAAHGTVHGANLQH